MKIKIYKPNIILILLFHASFINFPYLEGYGLVKYAILLVVGVFLLMQFRVLKKNKYSAINKALLLYLGMVLISSCINLHSVKERNVFFVAIVFVTIIVEVYVLFEYFIILNKTQELVNTLFYLLLFYCILTDLVMLLFPGLYSEKGMYYLIGNKFEVSYLHLQLLSMYLQKEKCKRKCMKFGKSDFIFFVLIGISFWATINVECSTGTIGVILLVIFYYCMVQNVKVFKKPVVFLAILLISVTVLMLFSGIVHFEPIRYLVEDVLHRDITLTGRLNIYKSIEKVFSGHVLFGYGMGSSFEITMKLISAPNTQNGVLEIILQQGIISLVLLVILIWKVFQLISRKQVINYALIILYIYIIFASVEITLDVSFLTWLALALVFEKNTEQKILNL